MHPSLRREADRRVDGIDSEIAGTCAVTLDTGNKESIIGAEDEVTGSCRWTEGRRCLVNRERHGQANDRSQFVVVGVETRYAWFGTS